MMNHVHLVGLFLLIVSQGCVVGQQDISQLDISHLLSQLFGLGTNSQNCDFTLSVAPGNPLFVEPPPRYKAGTSCTWRINAPEGFQIRVYFEDLRVSCPFNYLHIKTIGNKGKRFCDKPSSSQLGGNELLVSFITNPHLDNSWFRIRFEAFDSNIKKLTANSELQSFSSPNYPLEYPNNLLQRWLIQSEFDGNVVVDCRDGFQLEGPKGDSCRNDFLAVSLTGDVQRFSDSHRYCGELGPGLLVANRSIALLFRSDGSNSYSGFNCRYQSVKSAKPNIPKPPQPQKECHCGQANLGKRVIGGVMTEIHEYPWQAGISTRTGYLFCGGTLISDRYVATAAHCTRGRSASSLLVVLGEHDTTTDAEAVTLKVDVDSIIRHPRYNTITNENDIALIKLKKKITFDHRMKPPCFTKPGIDYTGQNVVITGWGAIKEGGKVTGVLREVSIPVIPLEQCRRAYGKDMVTPNMLCAGLPEGGKDSCQGDSGGPMVWEHNNRWHYIGIVSWGYGCARPNTPGVYTRVDKYLRWIDQETKDSNYC